MSTAATVERMTAEEYHAAPGLSNSGLCDLMVSPLRYWHCWLNPNRPKEEPTPFMQFGSALHCAVLEPDKFDSRYAQKLDAAEIEGCLVTIEDLRTWLRDQGCRPTGTRKADVIAQVQAVDPNVPIFDVLRERHDAEHEGKVQFNLEDWHRIGGAAQALRAEPELQEILSDGQAEQSFFVKHHDTGVMLKSRMDWIAPNATLDLKSFSATRGKPIDKAVCDAVWFEAYYRKAYFYCLVRALANGDLTVAGPQKAPRFILGFVESQEPHEVRIRELRPKVGSEVNLLWHRGRFEVNSLIELYADCVRKFGDRPWRTSREIEPLIDEEFPALAYGR